MVFYFLLVAFANVFVAMKLLWDIRSEDYRTEIVHKVKEIQAGEKPVEHIFTHLDKLGRKFIIMVGILIVVSAVILFLFVVQVASPIQYMINQAKKIAAGDLSVTLHMKSDDEIADLGNMINDLTVNLQEIIVQLQHMYATIEEAYVFLDTKLNMMPEVRRFFEDELRQLRDNVENIAMIKESFTLYEVQRFDSDELSASAQKLMENLLKQKEITQTQYEKVIEMQKERGGFLGAVLKEEGLLDDSRLLKYTDKGEG